MTQPPPGGYPPPSQPPPPPPGQGGYPQPAAGSTPAGAGYPGQPAPGYPAQQPPPGYPPAGAAPGYPPAGAAYPPAQAGYPPPGAPGYPPPGAPGYPPQAQGGYPPAGYGQGYPPAGPQAGTPSFDFSKISTIGWGVLGASLLTLIASFFNFWSASNSGIYTGVSYGISGWSLWWWIPILLALAVGVIYGLTLFGIMKPAQIKPVYLFYGAAASFVLLIIVLIHAFAYDGPYGIYNGTNVSRGPGFGIWFALITTLALTYFTALAAQASGAKLPFKVPGPA